MSNEDDHKVEAGDNFNCGNADFPAEEEALSEEAYSVELQFCFILSNK